MYKHTYICMYKPERVCAFVHICTTYVRTYVHTYNDTRMYVSNQIGHWALYYNVIVLTRRPGH